MAGETGLLNGERSLGLWPQSCRSHTYRFILTALCYKRTYLRPETGYFTLCHDSACVLLVDVVIW